MIEQQDISAEARASMRALYGENKQITDDNYDKSLAVKCINGTFVGKAKEWPLYDLENKQVMVLDEFNIHSEKESERKIVDWERTYFLTKYYML